MSDRRVELVDEPRGTQGYKGMMPPIPPDDPAAWYARNVQAQYEVVPDVTVSRQ